MPKMPTTNYEAIKTMSLEEMAAVFYMFMKPQLDSLNATAEQREEARTQIRAFLTAEVKTNDARRG